MKWAEQDEVVRLRAQRDLIDRIDAAIRAEIGRLEGLEWGEFGRPGKVAGLYRALEVIRREAGR